MLAIGLLNALPPGARILCIGAHADDIEIGCGGTLLQLLSRRQDLAFSWVVLTATGNREREARNSAERMLSATSDSHIILKSFRNGYLPYVGAEVKEFFETLQQTTPDLIFTHYRSDLHQDHRLASELTWNTFRNHTILEECFPSQHDNPWFTRSTFEGLCRLRGIECNSPSGYAEAFYVRKLFLA